MKRLLPIARRISRELLLPEPVLRVSRFREADALTASFPHAPGEKERIRRRLLDFADELIKTGEFSDLQRPDIRGPSFSEENGRSVATLLITADRKGILGKAADLLKRARKRR